jgi:hypothetical protein
MMQTLYTNPGKASMSSRRNTMRFFSYGILMNSGLLARILGRRLSAGASCRARLFGCRRYGIEGRVIRPRRSFDAGFGAG